MKALHWPRGLLPILTLAAAGAALVLPRPIFVNLGAGDEGLVRGFQDWERAGPNGRTMFRWTRDGATVELPAEARAERLRVRLRLARFLPGTAALTWRVNGQDAAQQTVRPGGWRVETLELGAVDGPLVLQIRSPDTSGEVGAAVDWIEIDGLRRLVPRRRAILRLLLLVVFAPMMVHLIAGTSAGQVLGTVLLFAVPLPLWLDPGQGLVAVTAAAPAIVFGLLLLSLVSRLRRPDFQPAFAAAAVVVTLTSLALLHPAFYYPDVDTHGRLLWSIRQDPGLALDPSPYQQRTGAWMRRLGDTKIAFPYSPMFHVAAWPIALLFGDVPAVKILAIAAFGTSVLLVHGLARAAGLGLGTALLTQVLFALLPVQSSRLGLALFPTLFAQALELAGLAVLAMYAPTRGARAAVVLGGVLLTVQLAYTGSLVNVAVVAAALALLLWRNGERDAAFRLIVVAAASTLVVAVVLYARFLPVFWAQVLPYAGGGRGDADGPGPLARSVGRWLAFYGPYPLLVMLGAANTAASTARRVILAALWGGLGLLALRGAVPALVRDVKDVELLAAPTAIFSAAAIATLARRRHGHRVAPAVTAALVLWGAARAVQAYQANLFAADR